MISHAGKWPIEEMANTLGVSRSGYYGYCKTGPSTREKLNILLTKEIKKIFQKSRETYGSPRIHAELKSEGHHCSRPRVARLMRQAGIAAKMKKRFKKTTRQNIKHVAAPNLLQQDFASDMPNKKWVADISYIGTSEGWLYIAVILDLFSRKVVGLSMSESLQTCLVMQALEQALVRRKPQEGLCHHSDKGCQYTSSTFKNMLAKHGIICSMSGTGNCFDNAAMESFFHTLKTECVHFERYETREQAKASIFEYIEVFYNNQRRHSTIEYLSPVDFEKRYYQQLNFQLS